MNRITHYDIIGDVHGRYDTLIRLLNTLGYRQENGIGSQPGHQAIFVGDVIDKGEAPGAVLRLVRRMADAGHAHMVIGNHELNWVSAAYAYQDDPRRFVQATREHPDRRRLVEEFAAQENGRDALLNHLEKVLALYRKRGSAEAHMGEVKSALDVHLSSTDRGASTVQDVMARNEVSLLLSLYAYQVLHGLRCLLVRQTRQGWSLSRMREQVLKVAATISRHARRITVHLGDAADKWWPTLLKGLPKLTALS